MIVDERYILLAIGIIFMVTFLIFMTKSKSIPLVDRIADSVKISNGLVMVVTLLFYFNVVSIQNKQIVDEHKLSLRQINREMFDNLMVAISEYFETVPNFIASITPIRNGDVDSNADGDSDVVNMHIQIISTKIFIALDEITQTHIDYTIPPHDYLIPLLQRFSSCRLQDEFKISKSNYNTKTQEFGELLINYANEIKTTKSKDFVSTKKKIQTDPVFIKLFT